MGARLKLSWGIFLRGGVAKASEFRGFGSLLGILPHAYDLSLRKMI